MSLIRFWKGSVFKNVRWAFGCQQTELGDERSNRLAEGGPGKELGGWQKDLNKVSLAWDLEETRDKVTVVCLTPSPSPHPRPGAGGKTGSVCRVT